jgi:hypothetical protein
MRLDSEIQTSLRFLCVCLLQPNAHLKRLSFLKRVQQFDRWQQWQASLAT